MFDKKHSISLLLQPKNAYDRKIIEGIGHYLQSTKVDWDVYHEGDYACKLENIEQWAGNGIIANLDDPDIVMACRNIRLPVVGFGGSYSDAQDYPPFPYVASDNHALMKAAFEHLRQKGIETFAFYGLPHTEQYKWAKERERAIKDIAAEHGYRCQVYRGHCITSDNWQYAMNRLNDWLQGLPSPVGIIAVTDARARHILQTAEHLGIEVPDKISVVGIDDDDVARHLSRISLSSVSQGCFEMGYQSASLLHRKLDNLNIGNKRILIKPEGVVARQSSDYKSLEDAHVIQAMHFIRQYANKGIKVEQVTDFVGVSRSSLEPKFRNERGHSIHTEIHNEKLNRACQMLASTAMSPTEIAHICGYPSVQYMHAIFKKHFNQTPKQYRQCNNSNRIIKPILMPSLCAV